MRRFLRVFWVVLLAVCFICASHARAATRWVCPDGIDPNGNPCYTRIQPAIFAAVSGDVIIVCEGVYNENIDLVGKAITVRSKDPNDPDVVDMTIVDGGAEGPVVSFIEGEDGNTVVSGFTLRNGAGGVFCRTSSPQITHCTITVNSVGLYGGGIFCQDASPRIYQCILSKNTAGSYGGGIYCTGSSPDITQCTISENTGGGIFCGDGSEPSITQCIIRANTANSPNTNDYGICSVNASPIITDCTIQDNAVYGIYYKDASSARTISGCSVLANNGAGIWITGTSPPNITQCSINDNEGIGIYSDSNAPSTIDTCIITRNEGHGISSIKSPLGITGCTIQENSANGINGEGTGLSVDQCTITGNVGDGVRFSKDSTPVISSCTIEKNGGSGIYAEYSLPDIDGCTISGNGRGGILCSYSSPGISNCAITGNASANGGGIYCNNRYQQAASPSHITNCAINGNRATNYGGAIYCNSIELPIDNCIIRNNRANYGGGIWFSGSPVHINQCTIQENIALSYGGGIYNNYAPSSNVINCVVSNNKAQHFGGICCYGSMNIVSCTIVKNQAIYNYGGIYSNSGTIISNSIIWNNPPSEISGSYSSVTYSDIRGGYTGEGNINADPLFMQAGIGNYYLNPNSPCMDSGDPNAPPIDREGIPRSQGDGVDMGAYEYVAPDSCTPRALFVADTTAGNAPLAVAFDASSSGGSIYPGVEFEWDFGDGNSATGMSTSHTYDSYGFYDVRLTITTECGSHTLTLSNCIKVGSTSPTREVGEGYEYDSIQGAIDDAADGEYILVHDGTYPGNINFKGKGIVLRSENGSAKTIIDGGAQGSVVTFNTYEGASSVLEGFTLQNGSAANGGGIHCSFSSPVITRCTIARNAATSHGGGIYCYCSSALITNTIVSGNRGGSSGGIYCISSSPLILNTTITGNVGGSYGGIWCDYQPFPTLRNCILWNNLPGEIYPDNLAVTHSIIRGGYAGEGNINGDPLFVGSEDENYYLNPNSPCIDTGDTTNAPLIDMEGIQRPQGAEVDIGAYEYVDTNSYIPRATFTADATAGAYPLTVRFDASASGGGDYEGAAFDWDFGDGTTAQG
ncbi:MAG: right-handed parallel beta-helix repeat-containing protein, partial [bacterium]